MDALATYLLALQAIPRVGAWTAVRAARAYPGPDALFAADEETLVARLGRRFATPFLDFDHDGWPELVTLAEAHIARHAKRGFAIVAIDDAGYPPLMRLGRSPAALLYVRGNPEAIRSIDTIAIVGTREPTEGGTIVARRLARVLSEAGFTVVSGLARGIDAAGHEGALDAQGPTVAIMGSSIDRIYPAAHRDLAERIVSGGGALVSEYPMDIATSGRHFVERDRLQAAMCIGVVAVQTGVEGGTLHTVRFARESGRLVVVPRPISGESEHPAYGGIRALMKSSDVVVVDGAEDYPTLVDRLREHRDLLLSSEASPDRDASKPPGQATLNL